MEKQDEGKHPKKSTQNLKYQSVFMALLRTLQCIVVLQSQDFCLKSCEVELLIALY